MKIGTAKDVTQINGLTIINQTIKIINMKTLAKIIDDSNGLYDDLETSKN